MTEPQLPPSTEPAYPDSRDAAPWNSPCEASLVTTPPTFAATLPPLELDGLKTAKIDPSGVDWKRVQPRYAKARLITGLIWALILVALAALPLIFTQILHWWNWAPWVCWGILGIVAALEIWYLAIIQRQVRALGYSERQDHLLTCSGIMFHEVRAIPYGRIQYVDVKSGPIESKLNLASVEVKTASSASATIPGLEKADAQRLRETLTELSDAKMVGL
ncbi:PH domain-containing protein [Rothia terrae]|uniref:PH domain-containing protein n=1 Tax=Rothia terrae TaxID=396015 RepID=UPI0038230E39